jgi:hypothetical protein
VNIPKTISFEYGMRMIDCSKNVGLKPNSQCVYCKHLILCSDHFKASRQAANMECPQMIINKNENYYVFVCLVCKENVLLEQEANV